MHATYLLPLSLILFVFSPPTVSVTFNYDSNTAWSTGCDFSNNDMSSAPSAPDQCGVLCLRTPGCSHFTWSPYQSGTCWMKHNLDNPYSSFSADASFVCGFVLLWHVDGGTQWAQRCDFEGNDLSNVPSRPEECGGRCASTERCTHFTWSDYAGGTCWLKQGSVSANDAYLVDGGTVCGLQSGTPPHPPPPPPPFVPPPTGGERLRITNAATSTIFIFYQSPLKALPFANPTAIPAGSYHDFAIPREGVESTRFWPGWGCNADGRMCKIGASGGVFNGGRVENGGDPAYWCNPAVGCAPGIDSKFEATFGCLSGCNSNTDWIDLSQVDGYTLPYELFITTPAGTSCGGNAPKRIDCRALDISRCPNEDNMGDLHVYNPQTRFPSGCFSPCGKLTLRQWNPFARYSPGDPNARMYCCPPGVTPQQCSAGPVVNTKYVALIHQTCPVYSYAYDDAVGLFQCPAGSKYEVKFYDPRGVSGIAADSSTSTSTTTTTATETTTTSEATPTSTSETTPTSQTTASTSARQASFGVSGGLTAVLSVLCLVVGVLGTVFFFVLLVMKRRVEEIH